MTRVALTMRVTEAAGHGDTRDALSHDWPRRLGEWGMTPILIPNIGDAATAYLDALRPDVLVFTGGDDLGATPLRDLTESALLGRALATGIPVFGVCRGLQLINTHFKGRLAAVGGHAGSSHAVSIAEPWRPFYGDSVTVNSFHSHGVPADGLAPDLTAAATDEEGNVEGLCHPQKPVAAVMWHPERDGGAAGDQRLLAGLAAGERLWR